MFERPKRPEEDTPNLTAKQRYKHPQTKANIDFCSKIGDFSMILAKFYQKFLQKHKIWVR